MLTQAEELLKEAAKRIKDLHFNETDGVYDYQSENTKNFLKQINAYLKSQESSVKYPIGGYAPGNYQCKCSTCGEIFTGDKRAVQCEPCAIETTTKVPVVESSVVNEGVISWEEAVEKAAKELNYKKLSEIIPIYSNSSICQKAAHLFMEANRLQRWIPVEESPLYENTPQGWLCTENGCKEFIAAVPYHDSDKPNEILWWIRHCVVEDGTGLCVVGDDSNEPAGWNLEDVEFWQPLPEIPKEFEG